MGAHEKKTVLVSGASTGIGRATVRRLAARGHRVFAGVRKEADADSIRADAEELSGGGSLEPVQLDVTLPSEIDALAERFAGAGLEPSRPVVTTCGSGVTACVLALGLHLLGRDDVAVYDGSWSEWGTRDDTPVET
mgnify:CR=1 FL=1